MTYGEIQHPFHHLNLPSKHVLVAEFVFLTYFMTDCTSVLRHQIYKLSILFILLITLKKNIVWILTNLFIYLYSIVSALSFLSAPQKIR